MHAPARSTLSGDVWGGVAATLVALPASIAFGVAVYLPLGSEAGAGAGALAGLLGAVALGTIAPLLGGTPRLITAPCAPAVAVMGAFAADMAAKLPGEPAHVVMLMTLVGLLSASFQVVLGLARAGTMIKYIPYPVVAGYMSGVAIVIFLKQLAPLFGFAKSTPLIDGVTSPSLWNWPALVVGGVTISGMVIAPRITKRVPGAIIALSIGVASYFALSAVVPELRTLAGNKLVIGSLQSGTSFLDAIGDRFAAFSDFRWSDVKLVLGPALTLAVVLSLDTLKTCVVVDALTGSQHDSNRELFAQGIANAASAAIGGTPGAGTSGPTLMNVASGAHTRWSGVIEGVLVLVAFLSLGGVVAWAPLAALAGILMVVAFRMFDWKALMWVRRSTTVFDWVVMLSVVAVAVGADLITASAVGVGLAILLFIRAESHAPIIRRRLEGNQHFSKCRRQPAELEVLSKHGGETVVIQLSGSLFFGTADQLRKQLKPDLETRRTIIFDLRLVDALDLTAANILVQMLQQLARRNATAVFCNLPRALAGQPDVPRYLREVGLITEPLPPVVFDSLSDALAWAEDRTLREHAVTVPDDIERPLELAELPMFAGRKPDTMAAFSECIEARDVPRGGFVFRRGDTTDEIFFVRKGTVRISLPLEAKQLHIASLGRGDFFGELAFLDQGTRSADAIAEEDTLLFALSRKRFDEVAAAHPRLGQALFASLAQTLAFRLRIADAEITTLEEA